MGLFHHKDTNSSKENGARRQSVRDLEARAFERWNAESSQKETKQPRKSSFAAERAARAAALEEAGREKMVMRT